MNGSLARRLSLLAAFFALGALSVPAQVSLVSPGSTWKYFDLGSEPAGWANPLFNDTAWASGPGQLGFGDGDEVTTLARTNNVTGVTNLSFYFRRTFTVPDPSMFTNLLVRVRRDDGAIAYLNGEEIFRSNMPLGPVSYVTPALMNAADDGTSFYAGPVLISLLVPGANVLAVEVHQSSAASSDVTFDLELLANVQFQTPSVRIIKPGDGDYVGASHVALAADASDNDGLISAVEFLEGTTSLGTAALSNGAFVLTWSNAPLGSHVLQAVAVDSTGLSATSAPVALRVVPYLVPRGAAWKYVDDGTDLSATGWRGLGFDDSGWSNGVAELGYGDGDEATLLNSGPIDNFHITTYFRHPFVIADPNAYSNLVLRVMRDDGVIAYLNGVEIYRNNMPAGAVTAMTPSIAALEDTLYHAGSVSPGLLAVGPNLLAVELHQAGPTSSDISLDLELLPNVTPVAPHVTIRDPITNASFLGPLMVTATVETWDLNDAVASVALYAGPTLINTAGVAVDGIARVSGVFNPGVHVLRAVATDVGGLSATSAPVTIQVVPAPILATLVQTGSVWRYVDANTNLGTSWRMPDYNDSSWSQGVGILGFGNLGAANVPPATPINSGPSTNRNITAYFRTGFMATNVAAITNLSFRVVRDDGVVVYLNNNELFRMNMPTGTVTYVTRGNTNVSGTNEVFYAPANIPNLPGLLMEGTNTLAVELHQDQPTTSDGAFDLGLVAVSSPSPPPPVPTITYVPPDILITWPGSGFVLQRAIVPEGPYADLLTAVSPYLVPQTNPAGFFRLRLGP